jgi:Fe2+ transport system protein FeoA
MQVKRFLSDLRQDETATIKAFYGEQLASRLSAMGFLPNKKIKKCQTALFGDPSCYLVEGLKICLRMEDAALIEIE